MPSTAEFYRDVPYGARENFMLHLAKATNNIPNGEIRFVYINGYIFETDGFMSGHIVGPYDENTKKLLERKRVVYGQINKNRSGAAVWSKAIRNAGRRGSDNIGVSRRGRSSADDRLLGISSGGDAQGNTGRIRQTTYSAEEIEELVRKLKEKFDATDEELASVEVKKKLFCSRHRHHNPRTRPRLSRCCQPRRYVRRGYLLRC